MDRLAELRRGARQRTPSPWTDQRVAHLKARWSQGVTAREIAWELGGGLSHSAVLGKIHRLGIAELSPNAWVHRPRRGGKPCLVFHRSVERPFGGIYRRRQWLLPIWVIEAKPYVDDPGIDADVPFAQRRSLIELTASACRWPVGDPSHPDFFFCGAEALQGKPYCAAHGARARRSADDVLQGGGSARRRTMRRTRSLEGAAKFGGKGANECERSEEGR
jgi:GcrA cell cycle regulator